MCRQFYLVLFNLVLPGLIIVNANNSPSCIDEDGKSVDWFIAYKFPELSNEPLPFNSGYSYAYITSNSFKAGNSHSRSTNGNQEPRLDIGSWLNRFVSFSPSTHKNLTNNDEKKQQTKEDELYWTVSGKLITDPKSIILRTLEIAYNSRGTYSYNSGKINTIYYNDGPPESSNESPKKSSIRAHAKGALIMDDITGDSIWLTHSTPQFPPRREQRLEFNENSRKFGQTFMCISYNLRQYGKQVIHHLVNMYPLVYEYHVSDRLQTLIPEVAELKINDDRRRRVKDETVKLAQKVRTKGGQDLLLYSKSSSFDGDLYSGWMDTELKTTLFVETWRNGAGTPLNSSCPKNNYRVNNVSELKVRRVGQNQVTWSYHSDHSKWAISETKESGIVCISDINRMRSQFKRGGGAVCIRCPSCWSIFSNTILDLEPCPKGQAKAQLQV